MRANTIVSISIGARAISQNELLRATEARLRKKMKLENR